MVKGLARFADCLRHDRKVKHVDASHGAEASGGYSPMTATDCIDEQLASQSAHDTGAASISLMTMFTSAQTGAPARGQIRASQHHPERTAMNTPSAFCKTFSAACMVLLFALPAHAELSRCSDSAGNVAYLDGPCPSEDRTEFGDPFSVAEPAVAPRNPRSIEVVPLRDSAWAHTPALIRTSTTDAATLKKAREIMHSDDNLRVTTYQKKAKRSLLN